MKTTLLAAGFLVAAATAAFAAPEEYVLDSSHSQIVFSYNHLGFSTGYGMFSGFEGTIEFDAEDPASSTVSVSMPVESMITGWQPRFDHFMSDDFFGASDDEATRAHGTKYAAIPRVPRFPATDCTMAVSLRVRVYDVLALRSFGDPESIWVKYLQKCSRSR